MSQDPIAFLSYVRFDDEHENGRLTDFCKRLGGEVRVQTGERFHIFQDRNDIGWGQQWKHRIEGSLDAVTFLIPIITPSFFKSPACRAELERFIDREKRLNRADLILPVYYVNCAVLNSDTRREADRLATVIASRQYADWRELRFEPFTSPQVGKMLARMAAQIGEALERAKSTEATAAAPTPTTSQQTVPSSSERERTSEAADELSEISVRPTRKTDPPTLVVDALHRGDYPTVNAALAAAQPGDRLLVRPGLYKEAIVIEKPVEIIGDGAPGDVVIEATGTDTIRFLASMGRLANLALRQASKEWFCIDIGQGRLDVEDCDITSKGRACVVIHGGADPRLRRNRIHDGGQGGVYVRDNGQGTLEDNEISGNALAGVEIKAGANPTLRRNRIHDGRQGGVMVHDSGQGMLEENDIFGNALAGVEIKTGANPTLRRNRIHDGRQGGVMVHDNGEGMLEENDIFGNVLAGVEIRTGGNPILRRNRIHDGKQDGVLAWKTGHGTLEENDIFENALAGVEIRSGGNPILRRNRIRDGKQGGVFIHENGQGALEDNEIVGNELAGVEIKTGGNPTLIRNRIHTGKQGGVYVHDDGRGQLERNDIVGNMHTGVLTKTRGNPTVQQNHITGNKGYGVWVFEAGQGVFEDNDLRENAKGPWSISAECLEKVIRRRNQE